MDFGMLMEDPNDEPTLVEFHPNDKRYDPRYPVSAFVAAAWSIGQHIMEREREPRLPFYCVRERGGCAVAGDDEPPMAGRMRSSSPTL